MDIILSQDFGKLEEKESPIPISKHSISLNENEVYQALSALYVYHRELQNDFNSADPKQFERYRKDRMTKMEAVYNLTKKLEDFIRCIHTT